MNSLNPRGFREIELADNINSLKDYYAQALNKMGKMSQKCINSNLSTKFFGLNNPLKETLSNDVHDDCKNYTLVIEQILELEQRVCIISYSIA